MLTFFNFKIYTFIGILIISFSVYYYIINLKNKINNLELENSNLMTLNKSLKESDNLNKKTQEIKDSQNVKVIEKIKEIQVPVEIEKVVTVYKCFNLNEVQLKNSKLLETLNSLTTGNQTENKNDS